jgi:hypothetical protein
MTYTVSFAVGDEAAYARFEREANAHALADTLDDGGIPAKITDGDHDVVRDDTVSDDDVIDI